MATTTSKAVGFAVSCPFCHDEDAVVRIDLCDVTSVTCSACDEEFSVADAVAMIAGELARWRAVARWVEMVSTAIEAPGALV